LDFILSKAESKDFSSYFTSTDGSLLFKLSMVAKLEKFDAKCLLTMKNKKALFYVTFYEKFKLILLNPNNNLLGLNNFCTDTPLIF
jgi:hypothetical protein